jgi:hypothetical protein
MPAGVHGKISIAEAKEICRLMLTVPQRAVPLLRGTPGVGKSDIMEQLAIEAYKTYAKGKGCAGCEAEGGPDHDPMKHVRGCGAFHKPAFCNVCAKDRIVIEEKVDEKGVVVARVPVFKPFPAHVMLVDIRLSTFDPVETKGLPYVADGDLKANVNGTEVILTRWACPEWLPTDNEVYCILFLDEYLNAPAAVQNASLQLIYDRKLHTHKLGRLVSIALAGNTEGDGSYITRLGGAAKNRLAHLEIEADPKSYVDWAKLNGVLPEFIGAVEYKPDTFVPTEFNRELDAQSTPRTFTMLARLIEQTGARSDRDIRRLSNPLIGSGATTELIAYISQYQRVKPREIVIDGKMPSFEKDQASHRYAAACAVANFVHRNSGEVKEKKHVDHLFAFITSLGPELSIKTLADMHLSEHSSLVVTILKHGAPEFKAMMQDLAEAVTAAENEPVKRRAR